MNHAICFVLPLYPREMGRVNSIGVETME